MMNGLKCYQKEEPKSVKQYLIANYSINTDRLKTYGVGHSEHKFDDPDKPWKSTR